MGIENNSNIINYVESVCSHVKQKEVHKAIQEEIQGHIEELAYEYINEGISEEDAINRAIKDMGEPSQIGRELNRVYKKSPNWEVIMLTLILSAFGLVAFYFIDLRSNLFSAPKGIFTKSMISMVLGMAVATGFYFLDYRKIKDYSWHLFIAMNGVLIYTQIFGHPVGIKRLIIGPFIIGPEYIAPAILGIALCGIFLNYEFKTLKNYIVGVLLLIIPFFVILSFPSIFAALFYSIIFITISIATKKKPVFFSIISACIFSVFLLMIVSAPYRYMRLKAFFNPYSDPMGAGFIRIQINNLINSAGMLGKGFNIEEVFIPQAHTNLILVYIIYFFGWLAGILLSAAIALFVVKIFNMRNQVKNDYGKLLTICISAVFGGQFILNILMVFGLVPFIDVNLPFISYGGSQFIVNMSLIGILSSVYRRKELKGAVELNKA